MSFDFNRYRRDLYARMSDIDKIAKREKAAKKLLSRLGYRITPPDDNLYSDCLADYLNGIRR